MDHLFVDPTTLSGGPFLAYDHDGKLVSTIYMLPITDLNPHPSMSNRRTMAGADIATVPPAALRNLAKHRSPTTVWGPSSPTGVRRASDPLIARSGIAKGSHHKNCTQLPIKFVCMIPSMAGSCSVKTTHPNA
ncbi:MULTISPECIES: hypothetical protein [unclassified Mesorhizobium]|uniref:hypothetical protein n=1 Tax=unclassified Mesorhizobium TaxID=325217 RepID=UPI0013DF0A93|nr:MULTISPECIES: hypothetical protein [unclassified Mesorhizobium]